MSCENVHGAFVINGLQCYNSGTTKYLDNSIASVEIVDSTFYMNMVRVDPTIDKQLLALAQKEAGAIRIHSWILHSKLCTSRSHLNLALGARIAKAPLHARLWLRECRLPFHG